MERLGAVGPFGLALKRNSVPSPRLSSSFTSLRKCFAGGVGTIWGHAPPRWPGLGDSLQSRSSGCSPKALASWPTRGCPPPLPGAALLIGSRHSPLSSDWLPHFSLRPRHRQRAASRRDSAPNPELGAKVKAQLGSAGVAGAHMRGAETAQRSVLSGLGVPTRGFARGAVPGKWAHEEREQRDGLLFASPQTGAGKSGTDSADGEGGSSGQTPGSGPRPRGARLCAGRRRPEQTGEEASCQAEREPVLREGATRRLRADSWDEIRKSD